MCIVTGSAPSSGRQPSPPACVAYEKATRSGPKVALISVAEGAVLQARSASIHKGRASPRSEHADQHRQWRARESAQRGGSESGKAVRAGYELANLARQQLAANEGQIRRFWRVHAARKVDERVHQVACCVHRQRCDEREPKQWRAESIVDFEGERRADRDRADGRRE